MPTSYSRRETYETRTATRGKKLLCLFLLALFAVVIVVAFAVPTYAEGAAPEPVAGAVTPVDDTGAPFTWAYLLTIGGATAATLLIVQFFKVPLDKVWKVPTRVFTYVIALLIMIAAAAFTSGLSPAAIPLLALNAFIVATSAYGAYEITFARLKE